MKTFEEVDQLIAEGKGNEKFVPKITAEPDPTGPGRDLWCWHLPRGVKEFHGIVHMVPHQQTLRGYVEALQFRFRLYVDPSSVTGYEPAVPGTAIARPLLVPPLATRPPVNQPPVLTIGEVVAIAEKWPAIAAMIVHVGSGTKKSFMNNLRTRLNSRLPEANWSITTMMPQDKDFIAGADLEKIVRVEKSPKTTVRTIERHTEEKIERKVTERSVTIEESHPVDAAPRPDPPVVALSPAVQSAPAPLEWPHSYLPADGADAQRVLDLHAKMSSIDWDTHAGDAEACMDELWDAAEGIKQYRDAKAATDKVLRRWIDDHFADFSADAELWRPKSPDRTQLVSATVIRVGSGPYLEHDGNGKLKRYPGLVPEDVKPGDRVLYNPLMKDLNKRHLLTSVTRVEAIVE